MEKRKSYVYKITCLVTGEYYFGSSFNAKSNSYWGSGRKIKERIAKYGKENFVKEILGEFDDRVDAHKKENQYIEKFRHDDKCLNQMLNRHFGSFSDDTCAKISEANRGEKNPWYGKHLSAATRAKISAANSGENHPMYGKHRTDDTRAKLSAAKRGEKNPMYGKHLSKEHKARISVANHGKIVSAATRAKISAAHIGKHFSEETKQKIRESRRGRAPWNKGKKLNKETGKYE